MPERPVMEDTSWTDALRGRFVVYDGPDGSGKSTQIRRTVEFLRDAGLVVCEVREPGGTAVGEQVRSMLLSHDHAGMDVGCEMLLYMASRAQLCAEVIAPALAAGQFVLADRFVSSTYAYQGAAGGVPMDSIKAVADVVIARARPDLVMVFDVDERTAASRLNPLLDRMEAKGAAFHRRVRQGYLDQVAAEPDRHALIDARDDEDTVWRRTIAALRTKLGDR